MKEEKVIQYIKDAGFWGRQYNFYCYCIKAGTFSHRPNLFLGVTSNADSAFFNSFVLQYFILNRNENGVGVMPFDKTRTNLKEFNIFIPFNSIRKVFVEEYKFIFIFKAYRLVIELNDGRTLELAHSKKRSEKPGVMNQQKFIESFANVRYMVG